MRLHPKGDYLSDLLRRGEQWEPEVVQAVVDRCQGLQGTIVDVGAMVGTHTVPWAKALPNMMVVALEPDPQNMECLLANVRGLPNVLPFRVAASDRISRGTLLHDPTNRGHTMLVPGGDDVLMVTLDSMGLSDVYVIKIDVEGHERQVLNGARQTIRRDKPVLVIEDWTGAIRPHGYRLAVDWGQQHQTYLWEPV